MRINIVLISIFFMFSVKAAVPTEEGLLKNLNNAPILGNLVTIKAMVQNISNGETSSTKTDFYKFVISLESTNTISLFQIQYTNGQMQAGQIRDLKYIPDLLAAIKKEKTPEKGMFYAVLMMLGTNHPQGSEAFLEKNGVALVHNAEVLNEEKMKLLKAYKTYLATNKGKGDANSPLNPVDPQNKAQVLELFRANTFQRSKNIELVKIENEFLWKADWKSVKGYFSNEERRLRVLEYAAGDLLMKLEAKDYVRFNGTNELPRYISFRDTKGQLAKMQILSLETKTNKEKKLVARFEEAKKIAPPGSTGEASYSFLF